MTNTVTISFTEEENGIYVWLKKNQNKSQVIKDLLRREMEQEKRTTMNEEQQDNTELLESILLITIGQDVSKEGYGSEELFIIGNSNPGQVLSGRVQNLNKLHPNEAPDVLRLWKERYPKTYSLISG